MDKVYFKLNLKKHKESLLKCNTTSIWYGHEKCSSFPRNYKIFKKSRKI